jgi:hypothetical protein
MQYPGRLSEMILRLADVVMAWMDACPVQATLPGSQRIVQPSTTHLSALSMFLHAASTTVAPRCARCLAVS